MLLPKIVQGYKSAVTRQINQLPGGGRGFSWQRSFYDRIIRNLNGLMDIHEYMRHNDQKTGIRSV